MKDWFTKLNFREPAVETPIDYGVGDRSDTDPAAGVGAAFHGSKFEPEHPVLALLPTRMRRLLLASVACSEFPKGRVVYREGEPCEAIYLVLSGRCESAHPVGVGRRTVFGPGDTLGGRALLNREPYHTTVKVVTRSRLVRISAADLRSLFAKRPPTASRFTHLITGESGAPTGPEHAIHVRRVVALLTLAPSVDAAAVVHSLAKSLYRLTEQRILLIHVTLAGKEPALLLAKSPLIAPLINGHFGFSRYLRKDGEGFHEMRIAVGEDPREADGIAPLISHCGLHYEFVLFNIATEVSAPATLETLVQSDSSFVLLQPGMQSLYDFQLLIRELAGQPGGGHETVHPLLFAEEDIAAPDCEQALVSMGRPVHSIIRGFPSSVTPNLPDYRFDLAVNRLAREIAGCRIGLALSSGGAKGLAHIGVIQVLEENGIEVDCIAGSSMGAYVGAIWASGHDGQQLEKIARENERRWNFLKLLQPALFPRQGFLHTGRIIRRLRQSIGEVNFSSLVRPLRVIATHLDTLERVVFFSGAVASAVSASIAIPGVAVPVSIDGDWLIDGGIADPLPVDVLREMGIERIIAVNVIPPPAMMRQWLNDQLAAGRVRTRGGALRRFLASRLNWSAAGNIIHIMLKAISGGQTGVAESAGREADVLLRPVECDGSWHDFTQPGKYIALGRAAALAQLSAIKAIAKGGSYENHNPHMLRRHTLVAA